MAQVRRSRDHLLAQDRSPSSALNIHTRNNAQILDAAEETTLSVVPTPTSRLRRFSLPARSTLRQPTVACSAPTLEPPLQYPQPTSQLLAATMRPRCSLLVLKTTNGAVQADTNVGHTLSISTSNAPVRGPISFIRKAGVFDATLHSTNVALGVLVPELPFGAVLSLNARTSNNVASAPGRPPPPRTGMTALSQSLWSCAARLDLVCYSHVGHRRPPAEPVGAGRVRCKSGSLTEGATLIAGHGDGWALERGAEPQVAFPLHQSQYQLRRGIECRSEPTHTRRLRSRLGHVRRRLINLGRRLLHSGL